MKVDLLEVQIDEIKLLIEKEIKILRKENNENKVDFYIATWESLNYQKNFCGLRKIEPSNTNKINVLKKVKNF